MMRASKLDWICVIKVRSSLTILAWVDCLSYEDLWMVGDVVEECKWIWLNELWRFTESLRNGGRMHQLRGNVHAAVVVVVQKEAKRKEDLEFWACAHSVKKRRLSPNPLTCLRVLVISKTITSAKLTCAWLPEEKKNSPRPNHAPRSCVVLHADMLCNSSPRSSGCRLCLLGEVESNAMRISRSCSCP